MKTWMMTGTASGSALRTVELSGQAGLLLIVEAWPPFSVRVVCYNTRV
jgi:hypothetical protein